jgi:hypothetical protein
MGAPRFLLALSVVYHLAGDTQMRQSPLGPAFAARYPHDPLQNRVLDDGIVIPLWMYDYAKRIEMEFLESDPNDGTLTIEYEDIRTALLRYLEHLSPPAPCAP